ncbi:hypothetical protein TNCV_17361 [Trichonephila clavipes]|nr:hypothetical protein TNCV_17361 [Trichonephila clavipes]
MSSSLVPLKISYTEGAEVLKKVEAQTSSRWCGVKVRKAHSSSVKIVRLDVALHAGPVIENDEVCLQ